MNGLTIQSAYVTPSSNQTQFNFPIAFDHNCISCVCINSRSDSLGEAGVTGVTKTSYKYDGWYGQTSKVPFYMIAIGY